MIFRPRSIEVTGGQGGGTPLPATEGICLEMLEVLFATDFLFQDWDPFLMSNQMHIMESERETILTKKTHLSPICTLRFSAQEALKSQVDKRGAIYLET